MPYEVCRDGISNTFSITPDTLGKTIEEQVSNLVGILDGYFAQRAHHINVNVLNKQKLLEAYENPQKYPEFDDSRFWLCGQFPPPFKGTAKRGHQPDLPPGDVDKR